MDKPFDEWRRRLRGMDVDHVTDAWFAKADDELSWKHEANFHAAAADRMRQLGNMAIDLDDKTRLTICRRANDIVARLQKHLEDHQDDLSIINDHLSVRDEYYAKFGTRTARYYMYEQGVIDVLGDPLIAA